ncbi:MAG: hypothetical protein ACTS2F_22875 [Thainema sp.]
MFRKTLFFATAFTVPLLLASSAKAAVFNLTIDGSDAIFLAGRTDLSIPSAADPWGVLLRHGSPTPEEIQETFPPFLSVNAGDVIRVADPAIGGVNFFNGFGPPFFGPGGNDSGISNLTSLGGISGYRGPQGPLVGVFLDDLIPNGTAPATLDFTVSGLGTDFASLTPELGQIFYIGDGLTSASEFQDFIAPTGATRLFLGIPDGFGFVGNPGAYDDNDGSYQVALGVNQTPISVPEPASVTGLLAVALLAGRRFVQKRLSYQR